ncbi:MAG: DUF4147 domain-containing protein [Deltaproteobacteria bacterium]|nr:DUF4147 domain-containing protein [Deltaproteobacteria bacterium]
MITRAVAEAVFQDAITACDPAERVREALVDPTLATRLDGRRRYGIAIGKAALAMARGAGPVEQGIAIVPGGHRDDVSGPVLDPSLPAGWQRLDGPHPEIDGRSRAALELAWFISESSAHRGDVVLALISGGASSLVEATRGNVTFAELRAISRAVMAAGAPIAELNTVRAALSFAKAGGLVIDSPATVITLAVSDVIGDELMVIGSGPTVGPWLDAPGELVDIGAADHARRSSAAEIIGRYGLSMPRSVAAVLSGPPEELRIAREDVARVIAPMNSFSRAAATALAERGIDAHRIVAPVAGDVRAAATRLAAHDHPIVAWGEPTLKLPRDPGEGGRAQQLALELARLLSRTGRAALVVGSDGVDGPPPNERQVPAGAFVDGTTWDAIIAAGIDPMAALERCDAGSALAAVGALVVTGPTGINHADLVILG